MKMKADSSTLWRVRDLELMKSSYTDHHFPKHFHEWYVVQIVEYGLNACYCDGHEYEAPAGSILLINPGEIHTGYSVGGGLLNYRCFYPDAKYFETKPFFAQHVLSDPWLFELLRRAHMELEHERDALASECIISSVCNALEKHAAHTARDPVSTNERPAIRIARDYMQANFDRQISLQELSQLCSLSSFHFLRAFRKAVGLAPAEYLRNIRIDHAKKLLRSGMEIIDAATACGFFDQSHLNRHFKRMVGLTPGQYRNP
jgi:AraC-like DNA-binding protein